MTAQVCPARFHIVLVEELPVKESEDWNDDVSVAFVYLQNLSAFLVLDLWVLCTFSLAQPTRAAAFVIKRLTGFEPWRYTFPQVLYAERAIDKLLK